MKVGLAWMLGCTGALASTILPVRADEVRLIFGTTSPPQVHVNHRLVKPWVTKINDEAKGALVIEQRDDPSIANSVNFYDRAVNDVVQITFGTITRVTGKFEKSNVVGLPLTADNAIQPSVAYWRLYEAGLLDSEYTEVVPLMMSSFAPGVLHFTQAPKSLDDLQGLKVITGSKTQSEFATRLSAAPVTLSSGEAYPALQRGVAEVITYGWAAFQAFKFYEVTHYHVLNASLGTAPSIVLIGKKRYEALPEPARRVIDTNRGEKQSRELGAFWDTVEEEGLKDTKARPNHTLANLSPDQQASWRRQAEIVSAEWAKTVPDGERLLATFREILAKVKLEDLGAAKR